MNCKCLRCDCHFALSEDESLRCRNYYEKRDQEPPDEVCGICPACWLGGPAEPVSVPPPVR